MAPLVGVGVVPDIGERIVGDERVEEILAAGAGELMGLAGRVEHDVTGTGDLRAGGRADGRGAGMKEEQFPLRRVAVVGAAALAGAGLPYSRSKGWPPSPVGVLRFAHSARETSR